MAALTAFQGCWCACFGYGPFLDSRRLSHDVLVGFLRFHLGCHHLRIHSRRLHLPDLLRPRSTFLRCSSTALGDEAHCLFLCEHPTIVEARDLFLAALVPHVTALLASLRSADLRALSSTGRGAPLSTLVKYVAVCVYVYHLCMVN